MYYDISNKAINFIFVEIIIQTFKMLQIKKMKFGYPHPGVALLLLLMLCKGDGWRFSPPTPASDAKDINLKLRLPNELEMGLPQSLQKEEDQENLDRSGKKYQHRNIHMDMNTHELQFHFGVSNPHEVDKENYQIVKIVPIVVPSSLLSRRHGYDTHKHKRRETTATNAPHFEMDVFGRKIRIPVRTNDKMLKGDYKVVYVDRNGKRKRMITKRMAQKFSKVSNDSAMKLMKIGGFQSENNRSKRDTGRMSVAEAGTPIDPTEPDDMEFIPEFQEICSQYRHGSARYLGAITQCNDEGSRGFITDFEEGNTFEVNPLGDNLFENWNCEHCRNQNMMDQEDNQAHITKDRRILHHGYHVVVRRSVEDAQKIFKKDNSGKKRSIVNDILKPSSLKTIRMLAYIYIGTIIYKVKNNSIHI